MLSNNWQILNWQAKKKVVFENLKDDNNAIKAIQSEINLEDVQKRLDDSTSDKTTTALVFAREVVKFGCFKCQFGNNEGD